MANVTESRLSAGALDSHVTTSHKFRPDIQGLRAIAVTMVVLHHLFVWPAGGFIGVDVFFVLSGYLITGLLLTEFATSQTISLREFYARRARRILPAATLVLVVTVAVSTLLFTAERARATAIDALWSLAFVENWNLILARTDYFRMADATSPVQQYWSLSVEEQFYIVWPLLLLGLLLIGARWRGHRLGSQADEPASSTPRVPRALVPVTLALLVLLSFAWAVASSLRTPEMAYFSTLTRVWELGAGALLAVLIAGRNPVPLRLRGWLLGIAVLAMLLGAIYLREGVGFPGPWALVPVLATVVALAAGDGAKGVTARLLASSASQFIGKISYSWYLWHWPVIVFLFAVVERTPATLVLALAVSLALSAVSYYTVEQPIRQSRWLSRRKPDDDSSSRGAQDPSEPHSGYLYNDRSPRHEASVGEPGSNSWVWVVRRSAIAIVAALVVGLSVAAMTRGFAPVPEAAPAASADVTTVAVEAAEAAEAAEPGAVPEAAAEGGVSRGPSGTTSAVVSLDTATVLKVGLRGALMATTYPSMSLEDGWRDVQLATQGPECQQRGGGASVCEFPVEGATKTAVIIGDSQVQAWLPGVRSALGEVGYNLRSFSMPGCPVADAEVVEPYFERVIYAECLSFRQEAFGNVEQTNPDLVIVTNLWTSNERIAGNPEGQPRDVAWEAAMTRSLNRLAAATTRVVILESPPTGKSLADCQTTVGGPDECEESVSPQYREMAAVNARAAAAASAAAGKDVTHTAVEEWFCLDGTCPAFASGYPIYADPFHVSPAYGKFVAPLLRDALVAG